MVTARFAYFLQDEKVYAQAEDYWIQTWKQVLRWSHQERLWTHPWLNTICVDGTKLLDGNSIFSAWCPTRKLAVRISQFAPRKNEVDLHYSIESFDEEVSNLRVLRIACALSEESAGEIMELLLSFVKTGEIRESREALATAPFMDSHFDFTPRRVQREYVPA